MSTHKRTRRKYDMTARAEQREATRDRIVAATVALHREKGPARTTIADIARRAGVQRLTVYNAFPTANDLFGACQQRFMGDNPLPDLAPAAGVDPWKGLESALRKIYEWYASNAEMERHVHRDRHLLPALDERMSKTADPAVAGIADAHAAAVARGKASRHGRAVLHLAFDFRTWDLLARTGLTNAEIARVMTRAVRANARL